MVYISDLPSAMLSFPRLQLEGAAINEAKIILADEATRLLHGDQCLKLIRQTVARLLRFSSSYGAMTSTPKPTTITLPTAPRHARLGQQVDLSAPRLRRRALSSAAVTARRTRPRCRAFS